MNIEKNKKIPVSVTVASDTEPVTVSGVYFELDDGFTVEFAIGEDKFTVTHTNEHTTVKTAGLMTYDITLCDKQTSTVLSTPFGMVKFKVKTELRRVEKSDGELRIMLLYALSADAVGEMKRSVDLRIKN